MFKKILVTTLAALPLVAMAAPSYKAIIVNHTRHEMSYAIGGVCIHHVIANNDSAFVRDKDLNLLCGTNTENCVISLHQSPDCSHKAMFALVYVDLNKGVKDSEFMPHEGAAYSLLINRYNNVVTVTRAIKKK